MSTVIARTVTRSVVPIILLVATALFLQGHNRPGGGFIAGVLAATSIALLYIIYGLNFVESDCFRFRTPSVKGENLNHGLVRAYITTAGIGLTIAVGSGILAILMGYSFLSQGVYVLHHVPLYGEIELASAVVFDLGVALVVIGSLLAILALVGAGGSGGNQP